MNIKGNLLNQNTKSKLFTEPKEKLKFKQITSPTSEKYIQERKQEMPKLVKKLKYYDESYNKLKNL